MLDSLRKCLALLGTGHRARWALVIALGLVASAFEMVGALLVFALLAAVAAEGEGVELPLLGDVGPLLPDPGDTTAVVGLGALLAAFFVLRAATSVAQAYVQHRVAENAGARLAARLLAAYLAMPYAFQLQRNSAELIRNSYDTVQQFVREALLPAVKLVGNTLLALGLLGILVATSPLATLLALAVLGPVTWVLLRVIHPRVKRLGRGAQELAKTSLQTLEESLAGWRDVRILGRQDFFVARFEQDRRRLARARYLRATSAELPRALLETVLVLFILGFLGVSVLAGDGALDALPVLGVFGYVALRLQPSLNEILSALNSLRFVGPGIDLVHRDLEALEREREPRREAVEPLPLRRELRLERVSARYPGSHREALSDVSLTIAAGEFVGVVGPTGGGKSTLVDVLLGLLVPTEGRVLVDGADVHGRPEAWHASLGVVHQVVFLLDASFRRNVALGLPDAEIDEARVAEAVRLAQLERFVASLPAGLDTVVGERGVRLSGGQRQRLAIARALYRDPAVLVLDEGTSALDSSTESDLLAALGPLRGERTIVAVAHRATTVAACDRVLLVADGRLLDDGPYDELAARHGRLLAGARRGRAEVS